MHTILLHLAFAIGPALVLATTHSTTVSVVMATLLFVSVFALVHDAMHRALGLPRWANETVLSVFGMLMGVSGAAARSMHIVHHACPGGRDDFEGQTLSMTLWRAVLVSPLTYLEVPFRAARRARSALRRRQLVEWVFVLGALAMALRSGGACRTYAIVVIVANMTIQVWGSWLPHRAPSWIFGLAKTLTWTRSPLVLSFVFHDQHHQRADLSCFELATRQGLRVGRRSAAGL